MKLNLTTPVPASVLKARHFAYTVSFYLHSKLVGDLLLAPLCRQRNPRAREMERPVPSVTQEGGGGAVPHKQADNWCENPQSHHRSAHAWLMLKMLKRKAPKIRAVII